MAIWRARVLVSPELKRTVVLITRNRLLSAVAEQLAQENDGAYISSTTMHSYVSRDYSSRFSENVPQWQPYDYIWSEINRRYEAAGVTPDLDHLIIDEGQNLPLEFIKWAVRFKARAVSVFADENQSTLYGGCCVADLQAAGFTDVYPLVVNHRNTKEIADVSAYFHNSRALPPATPKRGRGFDIPCLTAVPTWDALADIIAARMENRAEAVGVIVYLKDEVIHLANLLRQRLGRRRVDSYTSDATPGAESAIQMRDSGVTVISGESAIGLEFDTLYLQDLSRSLPATALIQSRRLYMLCARARNKLVLIDGPSRLTQAQLTSLPPDHILER
ncbi:hypothetical protein CNN82_10720 [Pseudomonas frederiksbergensis]|uniref:DNA helicase n=2 Tax=Pseudomonas frederiksbergensis TaxID=104087 RepID=A0AB33EAJ4_9PSED|nr:hypothetical protein CNN82_10720 [Pseudomonas frederiksbergensis]